MKKVGVLLVFCLLVLSVNFVAAAELDDCVAKCKANFENEVDRNPCMIECKELYGSLGENNFDEEKFQTDWDGDCGDFDCDELEIMDGGLAPDSLFYFFDKFMDGF
ncbi:MAG: hypothetical protein KJ858_04400 [Nanoarchaeota archaeon]|nr:hypothetical protein [Nanoarchaeota archaeon]